MSFGNTGTVFLKSRVARRILFLFVACALLPIATLTVLVFNQITGQLRDQSERRLHQAAKVTGFAIYERLLFLEAELQTIGPGSARSLGGDRGGTDTPGGLTPRLTEVVKASLPSELALSGEQQRHIASGRTLLITEPIATHRVALKMVRRAVAGDPRSGILIASINPAYLWGPSADDGAPSVIESCVLDHHNTVLMCSLPSLAPPAAVASAVASASSGRLEWGTTPEAYVAGYWSIFLQEHFLVPKWTVIVAESKTDVYAPVAAFVRTFPLMALLSLWVVMWLSLTQIRKSLGPLEQLQEGTRRIAAGDFDNRVSIVSGDEFEELAASFNVMSERLKKQFQTMATMTEIDRTALSAWDADRIVTTALDRIQDLLPQGIVAIILMNQGAGSARIALGDGTERRDIVGDVSLTGEPLSDEPGTYLITQDPIPPPLLPLIERGAVAVFSLPIVISTSVSGWLAIGHRAPGTPPDWDLLPFRQVADRLSLALSNVRMIKQIHQLAFYDGLTGLPNRILLKERLAGMLASARTRGQLAVVLFLDLDLFKHQNETLGHVLGDQLLQAVASRLVDEARRGVTSLDVELTVARLGGDEFTVLIPEIGQAEDAAAMAHRLLASLVAPFAIGAHEVFVTASVGITIYPLDGEDADRLLKNADLAVHHAKDEGRNQYQFYTHSLNAAAVERVTLENSLRKALEREEFVVHYQPKLNLRSGAIVGVEALIRWRHPEWGLVPPDRFIPISEESGLIVPIGEWVLHTACLQAQAWQRGGLRALHVAVNVSIIQLKGRQVIHAVTRALQDSQLDPTLLELELTETAMMQETEANLSTLHDLKAMGLHLAIDDFGKGYSSLAYLKRLPVDSLKIDHVFIRDIMTDPDAAAITMAIIAMAHRLNLRVIAEGVETETQQTFLLEQGCDEMQGYLVGLPLPAEELTPLLRKSPGLSSAA